MEIIEALYSEMVENLISKGLTITCMESMTGGFVSSCITDISGSSEIFKGSFVSYSNEEKIKLGVPKKVIDTYSVYSVQTAMAMAQAAEEAFKSDIAVGITGTAGNIDPQNKMGTPGTVYIGLKAGDRQETFVLSMEPTLSRREMKKNVAMRVAKEVLELIKRD